MACFTVTTEFIENLSDQKKYIANVLYAFAQEGNLHKVSIDKTKIIMRLYTALCDKIDFLPYWIDLMGKIPSSFETIDVDVTTIDEHETIFLHVCKETVGQKNLIVYSHQNWKRHNYISANQILFSEKQLKVYDRDEIYEEFISKSEININADRSIIALDDSKIIKSNIK